MNPQLELRVRNPNCVKCPLGQRDLDPSDRCRTGFGPDRAQWMIVTNYPVEPNSHIHRQMVEQFSKAGLDAKSAIWTSVIKCRVWEMVPSTKELKECTSYLLDEIDFINPKWIITFGNEALYPFTGRKAGINKFKGTVTTIDKVKVFHTTSPVLAMKKPSQLPSLMADLRYFYRLMKGEPSPDFHKPDPLKVHTVLSPIDLKSFRYHLLKSTTMAFDIESTDLDEHTPNAKIVSLAATLVTRGMQDAEVWRLPLYHPDSPFKTKWKTVLRFLSPYLKAVPKRVAHNGKHDCRWLKHFGVPGITHTFDTIMALAVLDENRSKGLKPAAQEILGAEPWGIDTKNLLETPLDQVLDYNGLDTWHDLRLYFWLRQQLINNPKQARLFVRLLMPAIIELIDVESVGIYVDRTKLIQNGRIIRNKFIKAEDELDKYLPSELPASINWNPSNFSRWFLFDHLKLPVIRRGKDKPNGSPGDPSMGKAELLALERYHPAVSLLLDRAKWNQLDNTFITPYLEILGEDSRLRTVFKPWGTVTGRMSSGKQDEEKTTGALQGTAVNLTQVPREKLVRSVFGAPDEFWHITADYSQVELRIAAFLSQESTMLHLYNTGQDIHSAAAMQMTGKSKDQITKDERQRAKARNFGFLYGMGWRKFIYQAFIDYGIAFSEKEARHNRQSFFDQFPGLMTWHRKQKRLAYKYGRVETPMGRIRHLPDIYSPDETIRAEAERQAINSPVQAMASDLAMLSMVLISQKFKEKNINGKTVGFVHDSVSFEVHKRNTIEACHIIKNTMENLPLRKLFNIELNVPLVADLEIGQYWGEGVPLSEMNL